jgi:hypothetical protein
VHHPFILYESSFASRAVLSPFVVGFRLIQHGTTGCFVRVRLFCCRLARNSNEKEKEAFHRQPLLGLAYATFSLFQNMSLYFFSPYKF